MKRIAFIMVFLFIALQFTDADARSRRDRHAKEVEATEYIFFYGGINSRPDATVEPVGFQPNEISLDDGTVFGGGIGTVWHDFRFELEIGTRSNDVENLVGLIWDFSATSFMINGYYDINIGLPVKPFLGVGVGIAQVKSFANDGINSAKDSDTVPAYQFMGGAVIDLSKSLSLFGTYRYFSTTDATLNEVFVVPFDTDFVSQEILTGILFRF